MSLLSPFFAGEPPPMLAADRASPSLPRLSGGERPQPTDGPVVSVVTIVRNAVGTIAEAIRSVAGQTHPHIEYIVVDGASTDGTVDVIREHAGDINVWISERDRGISDALNKGIALARGDIIGLLHADDRYAADAVEQSVLRLTAHPEAGYSFGDMVYVQDKQPSFILRGDPEYARSIARWMPAINHPTVFVRRTVYERCGLFRPSYRVAMDYDFFLRLHRLGVTGVYVPAVITSMRAGGASTQQVTKVYREVLRAAIEQEQPVLPAVAAYVSCMAGNAARHGLLRLRAEKLVRRIVKLRYRKVEYLS